MSAPLTLSVVIPTRDKAARLRLCLRALEQAAACPLEVLVVDDGSGDGTPAVLAAARERGRLPLRVLRSPARGRSAARNCGGAAARGERLLFLDDDVLADAGALRAHAAVGGTAEGVIARAAILHLPWLRCAADPTVADPALPAGVAARLLPAGEDAPLVEAARPHARRTRFEAAVQRLLQAADAPEGRWPAATGGNLSIQAEHFRALGGFDERLGKRWGLEDLELGYRAERGGASIVALPGCTVFHLDHPTGPGRAADHQAAMRYFRRKHGREAGARLQRFFAEEAGFPAGAAL